MPSFTSNSNSRLPCLKWGKLFLSSFVVLTLFIVGLELTLARKGFKPTVTDSAALWSKHRRKATALGNRALILIGGSRIQLGLDLNLLKNISSLEPVQLAVDGSSFVPVMEGLASDTSITGTIVVSYIDHIISEFDRHDAARVYQNYYNKSEDRSILNSKITEAFLGDKLKENLRSYADGARPITSLLMRALNPSATTQYLSTFPDRSRNADFRRVKIPIFYLMRVTRSLELTHLTVPQNTIYRDIVNFLQNKINKLEPRNTEKFIQGTKHIKRLVQKIKNRGGKVIFVVLPSSGMVRDIETKQYPRKLFWDSFIKEVNTDGYHFEDYSQLNKFTCPDGSHLDFRDKAAVTLALAKIIGVTKKEE